MPTRLSVLAYLNVRGSNDQVQPLREKSVTVQVDNLPLAPMTVELEILRSKYVA